MYRYFLFAYSAYYPKGGMNDCIRKFNNPLDLGFHNIDLYDQFYVVYDVEKDVKSGINLEYTMEEYEESHGDLDSNQEDEIRLEFLKDLIKRTTM